VLDALRGSEVAATSIGISATRARIVVFSLSAAIAAIGGGMMAMNEKAANVNPNLVPAQGLIFVVLVVSLGSRTVEGAIQAAIGYAAFQIVILNQALPWLINHVQPWYHMGQPPQTLAIILLSIGAFTYAKHPEGVLEFQKRRSLDKVQRTIDRFKGRGKIDGAVDESSDPSPAPFTPPGTPSPAPAAGSS
jgi:ABC-type branched-subunit amino acid transport system permease subunit